jgi:hypothetical protein
VTPEIAAIGSTSPHIDNGGLRQERTEEIRAMPGLGMAEGAEDLPPIP